MIYNGVSYHHFDGPFDPGSLKTQIGIGPWEPMVLFSGRMTQQKGPDILMETLPELRGANSKARYVFMGDRRLALAVAATGKGIESR